MRNFKNLNVWQDGMLIVKKVYEIAGMMPMNEKYGITSQVCRAAVSIPSNIAEGCSRSSESDFKRYLEIALGSAFELETQLILIKDLNLVFEYSFLELFDLLNKEQKSINSLISKVKEKGTPIING
jgi:four helix bundle protein